VGRSSRLEVVFVGSVDIRYRLSRRRSLRRFRHMDHSVWNWYRERQ
jgi:hypothetical protein